jgi:hypothetical protein
MPCPATLPPFYVRAIDPHPLGTVASAATETPQSLLRLISCFLDEGDRTQNVFPAVKQLSNLSTEITIGNWLPSFCQETRIPQIGRC